MSFNDDSRNRSVRKINQTIIKRRLSKEICNEGDSDFATEMVPSLARLQACFITIPRRKVLGLAQEIERSRRS